MKARPMTGPQMRVLRAMHASGTWEAASTQGIWKVVDSLVKRGLIRLTGDEARGYMYITTDAGRKWCLEDELRNDN